MCLWCHRMAMKLMPPVTVNLIHRLSKRYVFLVFSPTRQLNEVLARCVYAGEVRPDDEFFAFRKMYHCRVW